MDDVITEATMLAAGWTKTDDKVVIFEKKIENTNPINNSEDSELKLIVHGYFNQWMFAVLLPDGGMLNFVANSMAQLNQFESQINFYDPPF